MSNEQYTYADARAEMIDSAKGTFNQQRSTIKTLLTAYNARRSSGNTQTETFLEGVLTGLQMGEFTIKDMDSSIMRSPDPAAQEMMDNESDDE